MSAYNDDPNAPADDFDDIGSDSFDDSSADSLDEVALDDESLDEWSEQSEDGSDQNSTAKPKKKSSTLILIIVGLLVVGGGGFAYLKFSGNGNVDLSAVPPPPDGQASELAGLREEAPVDPQPVETPAPVEQPTSPDAQGFMAETTPPVASPDGAPPQLPDSPAMTAVEAPAATPPSPEGLPPAATPQTEGAPIIGSLQPVSDFPSVDLIKKADPDPAVVAPPIEAAPVTTPENATAVLPVPDAAPVPVEAVATTESPDLKAAAEKIKTLEKDLAVAKKQATADSNAISAAEDKVSTLEAKVAELEKKLAANDTVGQADLIPPTPKPSPVAKIEAANPVAKAAPSARPSKPVSVSWDLRGAQPGQAMLAKRGGGDIRTVGVGDSLPGLGRILSIEQSARGWVVKGTQGQVSQ